MGIIQKGLVQRIGAGGGSGTVTSVSVATANGFAGSVSNPTTTPAITITAPETGILKSDGTAISAATAGTDFGGLDHPGYVSTQFYPAYPSNTPAAQTMVADTVYAIPMIVKAPITIQALGMRCGTGVGGTTVRLGIYANTNARPGALLYTCNTTPSTASSNTNPSGTFASNPVLAAGVYWVAALFSGAPAIVGGNTTSDFVARYLLGIGSASSLASYSSGVTVAQSYASGLPNPFGTSTLQTSQVMPLIFFQIA